MCLDGNHLKVNINILYVNTYFVPHREHSAHQFEKPFGDWCVENNGVILWGIYMEQVSQLCGENSEF